MEPSIPKFKTGRCTSISPYFLLPTPYFLLLTPYFLLLKSDLVGEMDGLDGPLTFDFEGGTDGVLVVDIA